MTDLRQVLAANMKYYRGLKKLSQAELAAKIGTAPNYISQIEAHKQFPSVQMLEKIAAALEIDTLELFSGRTSHSLELEAIKVSMLKDIEQIVQTYIQKIHVG